MAPELTFLDQVRYNLQYIDYESIYRSIIELRAKAVPTSRIIKGHFIERARINYDDEIFMRQEQVSYISDPDVLANRVVFGRANKPHQSIFYGSIISPEMGLPRAVAYFETTSRIKELSIPGSFKESFTMSRWRILETFESVEIIYGEPYHGQSEYVRMSIENQNPNLRRMIEELKVSKGQDYAEHFEQQARLFGNEFAKKDIDSPEDYKISAAYANYVWDKTQFGAITYPSVPSGYKGQNVALKPAIVDAFLSLESVYMCLCERTYDEPPVIRIISKADAPISYNSDFQWNSLNL
jgi:hypothetical protein